jgi:hypothetical protein
MAHQMGVKYPKYLEKLMLHIQQPQFPLALCQFLFQHHYPNYEHPSSQIADCPPFAGKIHVHHLAVATFYSLSDLCGTGGMLCECICSNPSFKGNPRCDTVFVVLDSDESQPGMHGMVIAHVLSLFSLSSQSFSCTFVNWFILHDRKLQDADTGMWTVHLEWNHHTGKPVYQVIDVDTIVRGAHLLPVFGSHCVPEGFSDHNALDSYQLFFVNHYVDHYAHGFLTG